MAQYDFHYLPLEGKITGKQVLQQTEDAINDLGNRIVSIETDTEAITEAVEIAQDAKNTADNAETIANDAMDVAQAERESAQEAAQEANQAATNAANSASSASITATQLMEYLATKEEITAPAVDPTLSISGAAADSKVVGDKIKSLESAVSNGCTLVLPTQNGFYQPSATFISYSTRISTEFIPVVVGDKIVIDSGSLKYVCLAWAGTPSSATKVRADADWNVSAETIISEINGYYAFYFAKQDSTQDVDLSDFDGSIHLYANEIYHNSQKVKTLQDEVVTQQMMELCDVENVPQSANLWNPASATDGGGILANGSFYSDNNYCHEKIEVTEGDTLYFYVPNGIQSCRWLCAYDENNIPVSASGSNSSIKSYVVPSGIKKVAISTDKSTKSVFMVIPNESTAPSAYIPYVDAHSRYVASYEFLKNTNTGAISVNVPGYETTETVLNTTDGYITANGSVKSSGQYAYSQKLSVSAGDVLKPIGDADSYFRFICAYNGTSAVTSAGSNLSRVSYTVPDGIDGVIVSVPKEYSITKVAIKRPTGIETKVYPIVQELGKFNWKGNLSDGDSVKLLSSNVTFDVVWCFTGHVTTMGKITIGNVGSSGTVHELCSVDATKLYYVNPSNSQITSVNHGLTITEDLMIRCEVDLRVNIIKGIYIISDGEEFSLIEGAYFQSMYGSPVLISDGAIMTDCAFSWIPLKIDKPIWVFGDSWVSMYDSRWVYYMKQAGYTDNWMLNGFAGEKTVQGLASFENLLSVRKPEYLVWLYGMNDGDSSSEVNASWKKAYDRVVELCTEYQINLILYTVPNTPTINNNFKNAIVTASGYRYIDGVAAVGDDGNGNWFTGYEQSVSNHNHTSSKGAKALFMRILTDFPEIAGKGI